MDEVCVLSEQGDTPPRWSVCSYDSVSVKFVFSVLNVGPWSEEVGVGLEGKTKTSMGFVSSDCG